MARLYYYEGLLLNLKQQITKGAIEYITAERAYELLKLETGQDFGYDAVAWEKWLRENEENAFPKQWPSDTER